MGQGLPFVKISLFESLFTALYENRVLGQGRDTRVRLPHYIIHISYNASKSRFPDGQLWA